MGAEEAFRRALTGDEGAVIRIAIGGQQVGRIGVGAGDHQRRHAEHVGRQARGDQFLDRFLRRHQHFAAHMAAFLHRRQLVFKVYPAAPAVIIAFISSKAFSTPPKPASASATIGRK